jgi:dUTP pyrophosphatase
LEKIILNIEETLTKNGLNLPNYQTEFSSGFDLLSIEDKVILAGERELVATGIKLEIPVGYEGQVRPRSGLALKHGIIVPNSPGTIDADYRGEIKVILWNSGKVDFSIKKGDRIAQLVIAPVVQAKFNVLDSVNKTIRGDGGFGSTGI